MNSVSVQKRFGTTSLTVRMVPSSLVAVIVMCSRVTWVSGSILSSLPPQRTSACTPSASIVHSLLVRGSGGEEVGRVRELDDVQAAGRQVRAHRGQVPDQVVEGEQVTDASSAW